MNYIKPYITNDILSPCFWKKCSAETISSCNGCPEWFAWKAGADKWKTDHEYVGKHLKKEDR